MPTLNHQSDSEHEVLRSRELKSLTLGALKKRAKATGILVVHVEDCDNDIDPKSRVIELIIATEAKAGTRAKIRAKANIVVTKTISNKLCTLNQGLRGVVTCAIDGNALVRWSDGNEVWLMEENLDHVEMVADEALEEEPGRTSEEEQARIEEALNGVDETTKQEFARLQAENEKLRKRCADLEKELKSKRAREALETNATASAAKSGDEEKIKAGSDEIKEASSIKKDAAAAPVTAKAGPIAKAEDEAKTNAEHGKTAEATIIKKNAIAAPVAAKAEATTKAEDQAKLKAEQDKTTESSSNKKDTIATPVAAKAEVKATAADEAKLQAGSDKAAVASSIKEDAKEAKFTVKALLSNTYKATAKTEEEATVKSENKKTTEDPNAKNDKHKEEQKNEPAQASGAVKRNSVVEVLDENPDDEEDESF